MAFHPVDFEEDVMVLQGLHCRLVQLPQLAVLEY
jgi:hypothetical protein